MNIKHNVDAVFQAIEETCKQYGRNPESVNAIAVTKYVDSSIAKELIDAGIKHIGENRVEQFLEKYHALRDDDVTWHLIGTLQRRKVKDVINYVDYFHALDSLKLAAEIQKRATKTINCFLQVNISKEESKHGFGVEELEESLEKLAVFDKIQVVGLMTMAPFEASTEELTSIFKQTHDVGKRLGKANFPTMSFAEYSMGMSGDFKEAIAEGSTFVRIGTAFFKEDV